MHIGIDARLYNQTGIGRYIRNLIRSLAAIDQVNRYTVFLIESDWQKWTPPGPNWSKVRADIPWHSWREQWQMPLLLYRQHLDLVHFPYFNVPVGYRRPFVVTLHDLTILRQATGRATTRPRWYYLLKMAGYRAELRFITHSRRMIAISETVKQDIVRSLRVAKEKITVIHEAVDQELLTAASRPLVKPPYILAVGNFYPHKNLTRLVLAVRRLTSGHRYPNLKLILAGPKDFFYSRMKKSLKELELLGRVQFVLHPSDRELAGLYRQAECLVFPSLAEGFGLPGLEALALGCPVACSDIPVFREIYQNAPVYFSPEDIAGIASALDRVLRLKTAERQKKIETGLATAARYSWEECARRTQEVYADCLGIRQGQ